MKNRDIVILNQIIKYADEISGTISRFELDYDKFNNDYIAKNAIAMCILQIGESAGKLTDELKSKYSKVPWRDIVATRNRAVHAYGSIDMEILWGIATTNIIELKIYCEDILKEMEQN